MQLKGLTEEEVKKKVKEGKTNKCSVNKTKTVKDIIVSNVFTFFNIIFVILFVLILITGQIKHSLFMFIIIANTLIGIVQEVKAKKTIDKLSLMTASDATVIRNGKEIKIPTDDVVEGDILKISSGEQIYADCLIVAGEAEVNESLLTGESDDIKKKNGDRVLSGSFVSSGTLYCTAEKVGDESYSSKIAAEAKKYKKVNSEIITSFNKIIKYIGFAIIPLGALLFFKQWLILDMGILDSVEKTAASVIGMIPEGLYLLTSVALALSVIKLGKSGTLVQEMYSIESLARVDTLCVDKTGTITSGKMSVLKTVPLSDNNYASVLKNINSVQTEKNATSKSLENYFGQENSFTIKRIIPFSSKRKWSAFIFEEGSFVLGAPEIILSESHSEIKETANEYAKQGFRVLLLANAFVADDDSLSEVSPIVLIIIKDELRENVESTFDFFNNNDVDIKVISGDSPETVSYVAQRAGIKNPEKYIDVSNLSDEELSRSVTEYTVFGRVKPNQKKTIIKCLKENGKTPAMIGDGVNDVLALREASCSIAMANGSEAAKRVSNLVLMNSDFDEMPKVIYEGRRVINNITRSSSLFIVKTIYSVLLTFFLLFLPFMYPYEPIQLTLVSCLTIGIPSFILALEPDRNIIKGKFILNTISKALPSALTSLFSVLTILTVSEIIGTTNHREISTVTIMLMGFIGFITVFKVCVPFTTLRKIMFGAIIAMFAFATVILGGNILEFTMPSVKLLIITLTLATAAIPMIYLIGILTDKLLFKEWRNSK